MIDTLGAWTAAGLIQLATIRIDAELREPKPAAKMLLQVPDELVFEAPDEEVETVKRPATEGMENAYQLKVPLKDDAGMGPNWRDLE